MKVSFERFLPLVLFPLVVLSRAQVLSARYKLLRLFSVYLCRKRGVFGRLLNLSSVVQLTVSPLGVKPQHLVSVAFGRLAEVTQCAS
jgi:hypothetical protein